VENNKILIGVQFTENDRSGKKKHTNIELYVVRDITLFHLIDGIKYGLAKLAKENSPNSDIYRHCYELFVKCISETATDNRGETYFKNITFTSFNASELGKNHDILDRFIFSYSDTEKPICDLGFITSSRIIFDATGNFQPWGMLDTTNVIEAFNPATSDKIFFPEYNISSRELYRFDTSDVDIIPPTEPPKKQKHSLFRMLLPSLISVGMMLIVRVIATSVMSTSGVTGIMMILMSIAMGLSAVITTTITYKRQKKEAAEELRKWRNQYEDYIDSLCLSIKERQIKDVRKMEEIYPDMLTLINADDKGIYSLNENIYSRVPQDEDFLSFRIGRSDDVLSKFKIKGESKDVVFSEASYDLVRDNSGNDRLKIFLREDYEPGEEKKDNLSRLPGTISKRYKYLTNAPLVYSLKNKGALGVVDRNINSKMSASSYFLTRMIFELCYYHSPEDLQFVVFYNNETNWHNIENTINQYKFMPHFRGLFSDKSQFVFDNDSANAVMSSLLTLMTERSESSGNSGHKTPHVVVIVFDEHGLKEHAFAEFLPEAPEAGASFANTLGLSFVFAAKFKEYLPAYCDDIVRFERGDMTLTPREDTNEIQHFRYDVLGSTQDIPGFFANFTRDTTRAMRFFSSIYYAQIAQNGKVPSAVSMFEVLGGNTENMDGLIRSFWGCGTSRSIAPVTSSLKVPIGKTETGVAFLDLHEKSDGPHMLVAGTTGSGKTETVISYLLGLCVQYRPDELNMLLVDMKGGGFTKRIGHLPHVVGSVTDVDGDENGTGAEYMLGRFLDAMKSEIKRRKLLFNRLKVDSIDAYIKACENIEAHIEKKKVIGDEAEAIRNTAKESPLSHLILVVDEFTELKRFSTENSDMDFMGEITTIARVGRSLGFHIILISQNIEGAITEDIRVNSRARLCLKVATKQASKDMIGTELAASPYMPGNGRAYLLVGTGSKFEYFQSAYSGAGTEESIPIEITLASKTGAYTSFYRSDKDNLSLKRKQEEQKKSGTSRTQLEVIADSICKTYAENQGIISRPHIVFRSPLPSCIAWDTEKRDVIDISKRKQVNK